MRNLTLGIDPGTRNLGLCVFDGLNMELHRCDLGLGKNTMVKHFNGVVEHIISCNEGLWPKVMQISVEKQDISVPMIKRLEKCFVTVFTETFPEIPLRRVSALTTRAFFGTSVSMSEGLTKEEAYLKRKALSVLKFKELVSPEDFAMAQYIFGKLDDVAEAALLAIYSHTVPEPKKRKRPSVVPTNISTKRLRLTILPPPAKRRPPPPPPEPPTKRRRLA